MQRIKPFNEINRRPIVNKRCPVFVAKSVWIYLSIIRIGAIYNVSILLGLEILIFIDLFTCVCTAYFLETKRY